MILGSHNSLSFAAPTKWWMKPFRFVAKCQTLNLKEQWDLGIRYFDFRVRLDKDGIFKPAHGSMFWDYSIYQALEELANLTSKQYPLSDYTFARIVLEYNKEQEDQDKIDLEFKKFCNHIESTYRNIVFVGGVRKYDWKRLYEFGALNPNNIPEPELYDLYSSTTNIFGKRTNTWLDKIDDWFPWIYARLYNKKNIKEFFKECSTKVLLLDFVNIGSSSIKDYINSIDKNTNSTIDSYANILGIKDETNRK